MGQASRSSLTRFHLLLVSHKVTVKLLTTIDIVSGRGGLLSRSLTWLLASFILLQHAPSVGLPHDMAADFPPGKP